MWKVALITKFQENLLCCIDIVAVSTDLIRPRIFVAGSICRPLSPLQDKVCLRIEAWVNRTPEHVFASQGRKSYCTLTILPTLPSLRELGEEVKR